MAASGRASPVFANPLTVDVVPAVVDFTTPLVLSDTDFLLGERLSRQAAAESLARGGHATAEQRIFPPALCSERVDYLVEPHEIHGRTFP